MQDWKLMQELANNEVEEILIGKPPSQYLSFDWVRGRWEVLETQVRSRGYDIFFKEDDKIDVLLYVLSKILRVVRNYNVSKNPYSVNKELCEDIQKLQEAEKSYGDSWKKRGGVGAFMMLARKWDRIENQILKSPDYGKGRFSEAYSKFLGKDGFADDVNDLIRYIMLVRTERTLRESDATKEYVDQG